MLELNTNQTFQQKARQKLQTFTFVTLSSLQRDVILKNY